MTFGIAKRLEEASFKINLAKMKKLQTSPESRFLHDEEYVEVVRNLIVEKDALENTCFSILQFLDCWTTWREELTQLSNTGVEYRLNKANTRLLKRGVEGMCHVISCIEYLSKKRKKNYSLMFGISHKQFLHTLLYDNRNKVFIEPTPILRERFFAVVVDPNLFIRKYEEWIRAALETKEVKLLFSKDLGVVLSSLEEICQNT